MKLLTHVSHDVLFTFRPWVLSLQIPEEPFFAFYFNYIP